MSARRVLAAWTALIVLAAATTALTLVPQAAPWTGAAVLVLAFLKARVILLDYLGLRAAPHWRGGMLLSVGMFVALLFGLSVLPLMA